MKKLKDLDLSHLPAALEAFIRDTIPENAVVEISNADDVRDNCSGLFCEGLCTIFCPVEPPKKPHDCADCPATGCMLRRRPYVAPHAVAANADAPTRSAVCEETADANYDHSKKYITPDGKRHTFIPRPDDYVMDAEDSYLDAGYVVTVYKAGDDDFFTPVARHGFGSKEPTDLQIKWCILHDKGDTATVAKEYGLVF